MWDWEMKAEGQDNKSRGVPCIKGSYFFTTMLMLGRIDLSQDYLLCYLDKWIQHI